MYLSYIKLLWRLIGPIILSSQLSCFLVGLVHRSRLMTDIGYMTTFVSVLCEMLVIEITND